MKTSLKNPKTLRKYTENLQPQMPKLKFWKTLIFLEPFKSCKVE